VEVVVRDPSRAGDVERVLTTLGVAVTVTPLAEAGLAAPLVVSTVPVQAQPALLSLPWQAGHTLLDVLYAPWPTVLADHVARLGGTITGGLEVLFWQATEQVELMTGQPAPIEAMRRALDVAVATR
jgi:shikimate dehydrogenase